MHAGFLGRGEIYTFESSFGQICDENGCDQCEYKQRKARDESPGVDRACER